MMRSIMMTMMARKIDNLHNSRKKFLNRIKPHRKNHFNRNKQKTLKQCLQMHMSLLLQRSWYSIKEHALLSGLDCHDYPSNYGELKDKDAGDFKFVEKWFKRRNNITIEDVKKKLRKMKSAVNKKKMAALYFLTNVLKAKSKYKGNIEPFFLKVVDDLDLCEKFPWGRLTFDDLVDEVKKVAKKFKGGVVNEKDSWTFSGYILPIEAFAYECIPALARTCSCRERLSKVVQAQFQSDLHESRPLERHLIVQKKKIWWESLYKIDLAGRGITEFANEVPMQAPDNGGSVQGMMETMKALIEEATKKLEDKMDDVTSEIKAMVGDLDERLDMVECYFSLARRTKLRKFGRARRSSRRPKVTILIWKDRYLSHASRRSGMKPFGSTMRPRLIFYRDMSGKRANEAHGGFGVSNGPSSSAKGLDRIEKRPG
ncbi:unnamed protein product [Microthlaspi erraticum]|uniref:DUF1985 domain-containing protein n=1 Tax=Microthlaspi erraticum TaxID=1685480 RepID=A0A6D2HER3_9BRAS|nr:unnamed protein product [Microthlaspi erraticum]